MSNLPVCEVEAGYLGLNAIDADRAQNLIEWNPCCIEIDLVVAHADRMPWAAVDERDFDPVGADAELIELASGADRRPQPGKASPEDDDPLHLQTRSSTAAMPWPTPTHIVTSA
jgi:hypothetical protein